MKTEVTVKYIVCDAHGHAVREFTDKVLADKFVDFGKDQTIDKKRIAARNLSNIKMKVPASIKK
jgi:hypothetical protein